MLTIGIAKLKPSSPRLNGATVGEAHARQVLAAVAEHPPEETETVVLDFAGIEGASASYLKRLISLFFATPDECAGFPHDVAPILTNVTSSDLKEEIEDFLAGKGRVLIVADRHHDQLKLRQLLGRLDGAAAETFRELRDLKKTTAAELYERHREETTNQTAWNNRLVQLVELHIARRVRAGRFWIYEPTVKG